MKKVFRLELYNPIPVPEEIFGDEPEEIILVYSTSRDALEKRREAFLREEKTRGEWSARLDDRDVCWYTQGRNPCWEKHFQQGEILEIRMIEEDLKNQGWPNEFWPLLDRHAPGCKGNCNHRQGDGPPAFLQYEFDGGARAWMLVKDDKEIEEKELLRLYGKSIRNGWIRCSSHPDFPWGNQGNGHRKWFQGRFGSTEGHKVAAYVGNTVFGGKRVEGSAKIADLMGKEFHLFK